MKTIKKEYQQYKFELKETRNAINKESIRSFLKKRYTVKSSPSI